MKLNIYNILKNLNKNKNQLIGLIVILIFFLIIFYVIPNILLIFLNTYLGELILLLLSVLLFINNKVYGVLLFLLLIIIFRLIHLKERNNSNNKLSEKEGFTWSKQSKDDFIKLQSILNPKKIFDVDLIEKYQVSQEELDYYLKNKLWYWDDKVIELYKEAINNNPYIKSLPDEAVKEARSIYNQNAILQIMSYQTPEGVALLNGIKLDNNNEKNVLPSGFGNFPYKEEIISKKHPIIKCSLENSNNPSLEQINSDGSIYKLNKEDYINLEKIIKDFKFLKEPCNPCSIFKINPTYDCPFTLKNNISNFWSYLWNINKKSLYQ